MFKMSFCLHSCPEELAHSSDPKPRFRRLAVHIWSSSILQ